MLADGTHETHETCVTAGLERLMAAHDQEIPRDPGVIVWPQ